MNTVLAAEPADEPAPQRRESVGSYLRFVSLLVLAVIAFRSFIFTPFTIPSESMLPTLMKGDYFVAAKWPYGWSRWSLPFDLPLIAGTIAPALPRRGDIAVFRHPVDGTEYIKRVIGLPGDTVAMRGGRVILNGRELPQRELPLFLIRISPNTRCHPLATPIAVQGEPACAYPARWETLPGGRGYRVLDLGNMQQDTTSPITVPAGHIFVLGDHRDNSQDSRFPAIAEGGVGLVPTSRLVGRAEMVLFSTDGSARWYNPVSWVTAARWNHVGERL